MDIFGGLTLPTKRLTSNRKVEATRTRLSHVVTGEAYKKSKYLPQALVNMLKLLPPGLAVLIANKIKKS